jgi:hypothetical protein
LIGNPTHRQKFGKEPIRDFLHMTLGREMQGFGGFWPICSLQLFETANLAFQSAARWIRKSGKNILPTLQRQFSAIPWLSAAFWDRLVSDYLEEWL